MSKNLLIFILGLIGFILIFLFISGIMGWFQVVQWGPMEELERIVRSIFNSTEIEGWLS